MIIGQCGMDFRQREIGVLPRNLLGRPTAPLVVHDDHGHPCARMSLQPSWFAGILYDMRVGQLCRHESKVAGWSEDVNWTLVVTQRDAQPNSGGLSLATGPPSHRPR